jgi:ribosomal protein S18 acetylase RimI-like enzyme
MFYFIIFSFFLLLFWQSFIELKYIACSFKSHKNTTKIESIVVSSQHRGKKIGELLLRHCLNFLLSIPKPISLHVSKCNRVAMSLYTKYLLTNNNMGHILFDFKRYGFKVRKEVKGYYQHEEHICKNSGDAFVMRLDVTML